MSETKDETAVASPEGADRPGAAGGDQPPADPAPAPAASDDDEAAEHDPQFEPIVCLPLVAVPDLEVDEEPLVVLRAKLYRLDRSGDVPEWKERGTGTVKILCHKTKPRARVLMRRDKTLKVCANHFVMPGMTLRPNCGSDRAWVYGVLCDFSDEEPKEETLAIRFANTENAKKFKEAFVEAQQRVSPEQLEESAVETGSETSADGGGAEVTDSLAALSVQEPPAPAAASDS